MIDMEILYKISTFIYLVLLFILILKKFSFLRIISVSIFFIWIVGVIGITLFPIPIDFVKDESFFINESYNKNSYVPFQDISIIILNGREVIKQLGGNIFLLLPLSFLIPILLNRVLSFKKILFIGFSTSLTIELSQVIISFIIGRKYKVFSVDDLILNTTGVILGIILFKMSLPLIRKLKLIT